MLILAGATEAKEKTIKQDAPQQGVELLFPAGTGKKAKGAKLSKEQKEAASLLQKLKAIEKGGDVNAVDKLGQTALMYAAAANNRLAVCWLIAKGADATIKSKSGKTARDLVCEWDQRIKNLLQLCCEEKLPVPSEENPDEDYDRWVVQTGKISKDNCQEKLEDSAWRQSGFLFKEAIAVRAGARAGQLRPDQSEFLSIDYPPEGLAFLIRHGMPVQPCSATKWDEATPEHLRLLLALGMTREPKDDHAKLLFALMLDDVKRLESLLKQKPDEAKIPALYGHAQSAETVKALVAAAGGVPDATACLAAVLQNSYSSGAVKGLLEAGVPVPTDDKIVESILPDPATASNGWWNDGLRFVDKRYEDYIYINMRRSEPDVLKVLLDAGLNPNCTVVDRYKNPQTLLHRAATLGRAAAVELLLKYGADPNAVDDNDTPLSGIFGRSPIDHGYYAPNVSRIVQALLKAGVDPNLGRMDRRLVRIIGEGSEDFPRNEKEGNEDVSALRALLRAGLKVPANILLNFRGGQRQRLSDAQYEEVALLLLEHGADPLATAYDGKTTLMTAGRMGPRIAQKLLDAGVDPVAVSKGGETALKSALAQNHPEVAKILHDKGARYSGDLFICDPDCMQIMLDDGANVPGDIYVKLLEHGVSLYEVSFTLDQYSRIIGLLKKAGADPGATPIEDLGNYDGYPNPTARKALLSSDLNLKSKESNGSAYLFLATGHEIQDLIQAGADPHIVNKKGQTPLFRPNIIPSDIKLFVRYGVDVNAQDNEGNTALMIMSKNWWGKDCIQALLDAGADPNIKNKAGKTALQMVGQIDREEGEKIVKLLKEHGADVNARDKDGKTPLHWVKGKAVTQALITAGADVNARDNQGNTPLLLAKNKAVAIALVQAGADVHVKDGKGRTPIFLSESLEDIKIFVQYGLDINAQDNDGNTALMEDVMSRWNNTVQAFLEAGADPNIKNKAGKTALQIAREKKLNDIVKVLQKHGAKEETVALPGDKKSDPSNMKKNDPNERDKEGRTPLMRAALDPDGLSRLKECIAQKGDVNARDNKGCTALRLLMGQDGDINDRVQELLNAKADVNLGDFTDFTPLMAAACYNDTAKRRFRVQRLIGAKANVNAAAKMGNTAAMHLLLHHDDPDTLRMLLDAGADPKLKNKEGKTLLQLAQKHKRTACIRLLQEHLPASSSGHPCWPIIGGVLLVLLIGCVCRRLRRRK